MRAPAGHLAALTAALFVVCSAACARVAARLPAPAYHFLERNYVSKPIGDKTLIYEGQPSAHLFLLDGLPLAYDRLTRRDSATTHPIRNAYAMRVISSPMFRFRQLKDSSAAVRTPSFMPRLVAVEALHARGVGAPVGSDAVKYPRVLLSGLRLSLTHHSNGQAGCFREGYRPVNGDFDHCEPIPITDSSKVLPRDTMRVKLNTSDGDFSSTFLSVMGHGTLMSDFSHDDRPRWTAGVAFGYDWHPRKIFGTLSDEQRPLYGSWRVRGQAELMYVSGLSCPDLGRMRVSKLFCPLRGRSRITIEGERAPRAHGPLASRFDPRILPWRGSLEISHALDWALGAGVFVRFNDGQDYYNIGFANRHRVTLAGIMLDVGGNDYLRRRPADTR